MKKMFDFLSMSVFLIYSSLGSAQVQKINSERGPNSINKISFVTRVDKNRFEKEILPYFRDESQCKNCQLSYVALPEVFDSASISKLKSDIGEGNRIIYFDFNLKMNESLTELKSLIERYFQQGALLISTAGEPAVGEASLPLRRTLMGQIEHNIIVGEISDRDRLLPRSYFGPEIFTAIRPPSEIVGKKMAPFYFVSKLASQIERRSTDSWWIFFKEKKTKNKRLWLEIGDLFF